jgi:hypothetical protein
MTPSKNAKGGSSTKLLELFIRELVKNTVREEVEKILPTLVESIAKSGRTISESPRAAKPMTDRANITNLMNAHFALEGDTIAPRNVPVVPSFDPVITAGAAPDPKLANFLDNLLAGEYNPTKKQ